MKNNNIKWSVGIEGKEKPKPYMNPVAIIEMEDDPFSAGDTALIRVKSKKKNIIS